MSDTIDRKQKDVSSHQLNRRLFLRDAAALGAAASLVTLPFPMDARANEPRKGGTIKAGLVGGESTNSLDPALMMSPVPFVFNKCWGEMLLELAPNGGFEYRIAEDIGSSKDAKVWTLKIRRGIEFHNGKTVTADDVVQTLERHSDEKSKSGALGYMKGIDTIKASGDEVVITLKEANVDLPHLLTASHLVVQPFGGRDNPNAGIGAGPYKVAVNEPGIRHVGERFANYWQGDKMGYADSVEILVINDATARMSALQSGQVHMINRVEPKVVAFVEKIPGVTIRNHSGPAHYVFVMRCDTPPFDNNDLRMALKLSIDREEMVNKLLRGYGTIGNDFPVNTSYPLFTPLEQRTFDPDQAKFYYRKSGHSGSILLRTSDVAFPGAVDAAQLFQQSAAKAGINLEVRREPGDGYWSEVWNKMPFCASYWGGRSTQDQIYSEAYLSNAAWNDTAFKRPDFDKMVVAARAELNEDRRKQIYLDMASIVRDEGGVILPMFNQVIDATNSKIGGWVQDPHQELMNGYALAKCWVAS